MAHQLIMKRCLEPDSEPDISRGTLEGDLAPSPITLFRLQCNADTSMSAYIAEGEVLNLPTDSFGGIGVLAIPEMARFYRHVLIEGHFPHHAGVGFAKTGRLLYNLLSQIGISNIGYNRPAGTLYPTENPFN